MANDANTWLTELLLSVDLEIGGSRPCDPSVNDWAVANRVLAQGTLGLGEAYVEGLWDCPAVDQLFDKVISGKLYKKIRPDPRLLARIAKAKFVNMQSRRNSLRVAKLHYNLGNDFYEAMLDPWMQYTCAYWQNGATTLEAAQEAKLDLVCRKLDLKPGERVLELGCGWGGFARFASSRYGVEVVAYNIATEQVAYAREKCQGLPVEIHLADYRDAVGTFDKAVSIGMCEHVGTRNYRAFLRLVHDRLRPGGLFLLHTIAGNHVAHHMEAWLDKYIFPGSVLPAPTNLGAAMDNLFVVEDWHNFGVDYDKTLMAWHERFVKAWPNFRDRFGEPFFRMWSYYLLCCAGTFRSRHNQLFQITLSKGGVRGGWKPAR